MKAALGLAKPAQWQTLGRNEQLTWGECKGSGAKPYQVRVDLSDAAFKCSCPSRKLPCKHTLGLLLLFASNATPQAETPEFVKEWHGNRAKRAEAKAAKASAPPSPVDEQAQQKRAAKRESRVESGLQLLESALADLINQGLAAARSQPPSYWSQLASRLVDAQAPGLARRVAALGDSLVSSGDWQSIALAEMGRLQLLIDAYQKLPVLAPELAAEVRNAIGFTQEQKELLSRAGVRDRWLVAGREQIEDGNMRVQRSWLLGIESHRAALLLDFAVGNQPLPASLTVGQCVDAELVYFDGAPPLRVLVKERFAAPTFDNRLPEGLNVASVQALFAERLTCNPWLDRWPVVVGPAIPLYQSDSQFALVDSAGRLLSMTPNCRHGEHLLAVSGGEPLTVFGTYDGHALLPLSISTAQHFFGLGTMQSLAILSKVA